MQIQILLVEDFRPYRDFVTSLLAKNPDLRIIGDVSDGLEAVERAQQLKPDLVLMDIGLPKLNGLEAARRIRDLVPSSRIVFVTEESSAEVVKKALSLGAWGYVLKRRGGTDLLAAVAAVPEGKRFISDGLDHNGFALANGAGEAT